MDADYTIFPSEPQEADADFCTADGADIWGEPLADKQQRLSGEAYTATLSENPL